MDHIIFTAGALLLCAILFNTCSISSLRSRGRSSTRIRFLKILLETIRSEEPKIRTDTYEWSKDFDLFKDRYKVDHSRNITVTFWRHSDDFNKKFWPHIRLSDGYIAGDARYYVRNPNDRLAAENLLDHNEMTNKNTAQPIPRAEWKVLLKIIAAAKQRILDLEAKSRT